LIFYSLTSDFKLHDQYKTINGRYVWVRVHKLHSIINTALKFKMVLVIHFIGALSVGNISLSNGMTVLILTCKIMDGKKCERYL